MCAILFRFKNKTLHPSQNVISLYAILSVYVVSLRKCTEDRKSIFKFSFGEVLHTQKAPNPN